MGDFDPFGHGLVGVILDTAITCKECAKKFGHPKPKDDFFVRWFYIL